MTLPTFTMRQLLEAGVHFGHQTRRWNPKMAPFIYGERGGIHIIDLQQTVPLLYAAMNAIKDVVSGGGRILFVGTKRQASDAVTQAATRCGQYYINHRWLGGTLTNWRTISVSIKRLRDFESQLEADDSGLTKKELLKLERQRNKIERALGGIKEMGGQPDIMIVIDTNKEEIAIQEAKKLGIPVIAVLDSNSNPDGITYPVPGNDDALRAIKFYCDLFSGAVLDGIQAEMVTRGEDIGASEEGPIETIVAKAGAAAPAKTPDAPAEAPAAPADKKPAADAAKTADAVAEKPAT
jgi:small subunit ribosomal protein S2